ncbi:MAG: CoA-binding protein [Gemmatimonadetes bacterium]|nr:MAG: CoA-binding protein [Gemmatimonadota bacterium]
MLVQELIHPQSIVVVGGSNDVTKPGGKVLKNLIEGHFQGQLYVVNPKETEVQGIPCTQNLQDLPAVDLAIISIPAKFVVPTVTCLAQEKNTKGFIVLSAGFSEVNAAGRALENQLVDIVRNAGGALIGPNCMGVLTTHYHGTFGGPIPKLAPEGVDFVSGSGATAAFIMEAGIPRGLTFSSMWSVGNSAHIGVEDVLQYWDEHFDPETSSRVKMIYLEKIDKPDQLLKHASSLIRKGCRIVGLKAGASEAGIRAASSHTGALASSDTATEALFRKAGIVRCHSREELITVAGIFCYKPLTGKNIAIITHAGGPGVMLADALSEGGLNVPPITGEAADELLTKLYPGSAVGNPIDFLATGTAEQLGTIIDYVDQKFANIDAMVVIFGTPGLFDITEVYTVLNDKMNCCQKPIYPVLPSIVTAAKEVEYFLSLGRVNCPDEVALGRALAKVYHTPAPAIGSPQLPDIDTATIRAIIERAKSGYLPPAEVQGLLDAAGIPRVREAVVNRIEDALEQAETFGFPVVMKVVGPVHKSDVGGIALNVTNRAGVISQFDRLMRINGATAVLIQPMLTGMELFAGAKKEPPFGHLILCGLGGIYIEVWKDVMAGLAPLGMPEAHEMIRRLKGYKLIQGVRGQRGIDEDRFAEVIVHLSALLQVAPEITELDINPLLGTGEQVIAVDARIHVEK